MNVMVDESLMSPRSHTQITWRVYEGVLARVDLWGLRDAGGQRTTQPMRWICEAFPGNRFSGTGWCVWTSPRRKLPRFVIAPSKGCKRRPVHEHGVE